MAACIFRSWLFAGVLYNAGMEEAVVAPSVAPIMAPSVASKIEEYKRSRGLSTSERAVISKECRRLSKDLGIKQIPPRQYLFLRKIAEKLRLGQTLDLRELAKTSGYPQHQASHPQNLILKHIDDKVFSAIVGFSSKDVEYELMKVIKQDVDLSAKMRALDLATKVLGMTDDNVKVQVQIANLPVVLDK